MKAGCGRISTITEEVKNFVDTSKIGTVKEEIKNMIRVGKQAPKFTAPAFKDGKFTQVSLDDYKGKWVLLCFYPGDFTFV